MKKLKILLESGIEDINRITKGRKWVDIYFHEDLDGVCTAIGMKKYLEEYGIKLRNCYTIQYGSEYEVKKPSNEPEVITALVDFSHKKIGVTIHIDHHTGHAGESSDSQTKVQFRQSPSNTETISGIISPSDIFPPEDIKWINMIDSADFLKYGVNPDEFIVSNPKFTSNTDENKKIMLLAVNRILLVYKDKNNLMTDTVKQSDSSIISLYQTVKKLSKNFPNINDIDKNAKEYQRTIKSEKNISFNEKTGLLVINFLHVGRKPGAYDRYAIFKTYPDSLIKIHNFSSMIQISKNPFRQSNVNVKDTTISILNNYKKYFENIKIGIAKIKGIAAHDDTTDMMGFKYADLMQIYGQHIEGLTSKNESRVKELFNKTYPELTSDDKDWLNDNFKISIWNIIQSQSGGHTNIYNIAGLEYIKREVEEETHVKKNLMNDLIKKFNEELTNKQKLTEITKFKSLLNIK